MGYHLESVNLFGVEFSEDELEQMVSNNKIDTNKYKLIDFVGSFDGADSRIHNFTSVFVFPSYSWSTDSDHKLNGNTNIDPTDNEIRDFKNFCSSNKIPVKDPKRIVRKYIF